MSLRAFHIVFVTVATLMCVFLAVWSFVLAENRDAMITALGAIGVLGALGMPVYGVFFFRKLRNLPL